MNCSRCAGTGYTSFKHVENGRCFQCEGTGGVLDNGQTITARKASGRINRDSQAAGVRVRSLLGCATSVSYVLETGMWADIPMLRQMGVERVTRAARLEKKFGEDHRFSDAVKTEVMSWIICGNKGMSSADVAGYMAEICG